MKISTKGRYALRLMIYLANSGQGNFVALKDIADSENISKKYLEQIVPLLNKSGMLRTNRGYQGGYTLAKAPSEYTVGDVLRVTEGDIFPVACLTSSPNECPRASECVTLPIWQGLYETVANYLDSITLQDIIDKYCSDPADNYYI